jgi:hypothetical protein
MKQNGFLWGKKLSCKRTLLNEQRENPPDQYMSAGTFFSMPQPSQVNTTRLRKKQKKKRKKKVPQSTWNPFRSFWGIPKEDSSSDDSEEEEPPFLNPEPSAPLENPTQTIRQNVSADVKGEACIALIKVTIDGEPIDSFYALENKFDAPVSFIRTITANRTGFDDPYSVGVPYSSFKESFFIPMYDLTGEEMKI